jgi:hypothetical protein
LLTLKLEDPSDKVRNSAKATFLASLFEYARSPTAVLLSVIANEPARPSWFSPVFKDAYLHNSEQFKAVIVEVVDAVCSDATAANAALLLEFCELLPGACVAYHPQLIACFNACQEAPVLISLTPALTALVNRLTSPNRAIFGMMLKPMEAIICSQRASVVRPVVELFANTVKFVLPDATALDSLQSQFMTFLRQNIANVQHCQNDSDSLVGQICRALFASGCIFRFYGAKNQKLFGNALWGPVNHFFRCPLQRVRSMVLNCACDICARDPGFIDKAKALVSAAFELGPPQSIAALTFLANLTEQESQGEDTSAIDEIRPMYSSNLLQSYLSQIIQSFQTADSAIRTESLRLARIALAHGMINPHAIIPHVIALLCSPEQSKLAALVISDAVNHYSFAGAVGSRLTDGLRDSFAFVKTAQIVDGTGGLAQLYKILPVPLQKDLLIAIVARAEETLTQPTEPDWILWLMQSLANIEFGQTAEPAFLVKMLSTGSVHTYLRMVAKDAKEVIYALGNKAEIPRGAASPKSWYAAILIARTKQWIMKRYQIDLKKLEKAVKDAKTVKIAKVKPLDLAAVPKPEDIGLTNGVLDLGANLLSAMRMERSLDPSEGAS